MVILKKLKDYIKLIRVKHYMKNFLIFLPIIFSRNLLDSVCFLKCLVGFGIFSFTCSIVYILNDIRDREKDRNHEKKRFRPIASGSVSIGEAISLIFCLILAIIILVCLANLNFVSIILLLIYLIINIGYSFGLKNVALIDLIILVSGFVIRVLFGGFIIGVEVSNWLNLTIMAVAFYLALGKRRNELMNSKKDTREVLKYYSKEFLDKNMYMCLTLGIMFYALWTVDIRVVEMANNNLIWTVPIVIIICMRYNMIVENNSDGDPVEVVIHDKILMFLLVVYAFILIGILYL